MRRQIRQMAIAAMAGLAVFLGTGQAQAFDSTGALQMVTPVWCTASSIHYDPVGTNAWVLTGAEEADGVYWGSATPTTIFPPITAANIETECSQTDVTILSQNGADGTYVSDGYLGITWTGREADGLLYSYELAIKGASSTTLVATRTLIGASDEETTQDAIAGAMLSRANLLMANQPGLSRFLSGTGAGSSVTRADNCNGLSANAINGAGFLNGCVMSGNAWAELSGSWNSASSYALGSLGAHAQIHSNLIVGGMLQFDHFESDASDASGNGWMVGPYFAAQLGNQPLFLEGRLLYGQTDNEISPLGTSLDRFETERVLAQLRASGEYHYGSLLLVPLLDVTYSDDSQQSYTDGLGNLIPGTKIALTQVSLGMDFDMPLAVSSGALALTGGLSGVYSQTDADVVSSFEGGRGRTDLGLTYEFAGNGRLWVSSFYDGIASDYESYGASLGVELAF